MSVYSPSTHAAASYNGLAGVHYGPIEIENDALLAETTPRSAAPGSLSFFAIIASLWCAFLIPQLLLLTIRLHLFPLDLPITRIPCWGPIYDPPCSLNVVSLSPRALFSILYYQ